MKVICLCFICLLLSCHTSLLPSAALLQQQGYTRQNATFRADHDRDSISLDYIGGFYDDVKRVDKSNKAFLQYPSVKRRIRFSIGFEQETSPYSKDTIEVYVQHRLVNMSEHASTLESRYSWAFRKYPHEAKFKYLNRNKETNAPIMILFHNRKIYLDTIIPLRFRNVRIRFPQNDFNIFFEDPMD